MSTRNRRLAINIILCLAALIVGAGSFAGLAALREPPPKREIEERQFNVEVFEVQRADLSEFIAGFGTVRAEHDVEYSAQVAGEVVWQSPRLKIGELVAGPAFEPQGAKTQASRQTSGDLLLTIDPEIYQEKQVRADNAIAEAQAELERLDQEETNT